MNPTLPCTFFFSGFKKGCFAYVFNTLHHQDYDNELPDQHYYMPEGMFMKGKQEFEQWHAQQRADHVRFHLRDKLLVYCQSDVHLLKPGCLTFKQDFKLCAGFDPFKEMTIASACNRYLCMHCMEANTISSKPLRGWRHNTNHSKVAMEWLL